jgi:rare lipoprotein A
MTIISIILFFSFSFAEGKVPYQAEGLASFYADRLHSRKTASGEPYDRQKLTAAHPSLPFNTYVLVTNIQNGKSVTVRINDRMKAGKPIIIDLSRAAAVQIDLVQEGTAMVRLKEVETDAPSWHLSPLEEGDSLTLPSPLRK